MPGKEDGYRARMEYLRTLLLRLTPQQRETVLAMVERVLIENDLDRPATRKNDPLRPAS